MLCKIGALFLLSWKKRLRWKEKRIGGMTTRELKLVRAAGYVVMSGRWMRMNQSNIYKTKNKTKQIIVFETKFIHPYNTTIFLASLSTPWISISTRAFESLKSSLVILFLSHQSDSPLLPHNFFFFFFFCLRFSFVDFVKITSDFPFFFQWKF